jgi:hypothetical protein
VCTSAAFVCFSVDKYYSFFSFVYLNQRKLEQSAQHQPARSEPEITEIGIIEGDGSPHVIRADVHCTVPTPSSVGSSYRHC